MSLIHLCCFIVSENNVKILAHKSGCVNFLANFMSGHEETMIGPGSDKMYPAIFLQVLNQQITWGKAIYPLGIAEPNAIKKEISPTQEMCINMELYTPSCMQQVKFRSAIASENKQKEVTFRFIGE